MRDVVRAAVRDACAAYGLPKEAQTLMTPKQVGSETRALAGSMDSVQKKLRRLPPPSVGGLNSAAKPFG